MSKAFTRGCGWGVLLGVVLTLVLPVLFLGCFGTIGTGLGFPVYSASLDVVTDPEVEESLRATANWLEVGPEDRLDREILEACGEWGDPITPEEADYILELWLSRLGDVEQSQVDGWPLLDSWTQEHGLTHIFCGEPQRERLGGLHFEPRMDEALRERWVFLDPERRVRVRGDLVQAPLYFEHGGSYEKTRPHKSYVRRLDASTILLMTTLAAMSRPTKACTVPIPGKDLLWRVYVRDGAITTAFPVERSDRTPRCRTLNSRDY